MRLWRGGGRIEIEKERDEIEIEIEIEIEREREGPRQSCECLSSPISYPHFPALPPPLLAAGRLAASLEAPTLASD